MVRLKFCNDFKMLESSKPWEWCQTLFRLKLKSLLPPEWLTFIIQNLYKNICLNMVYNLSISTHIKKSFISNIFTKKENLLFLYRVTSACHTIISKEIIMFNLNSLNHFLQFIRHNPMNSNSIFIFRGIVGHIFEWKSAERLEELVLIEFENILRHFTRNKCYWNNCLFVKYR